MSDKYPGGFVTANAPAGFSVAFDGTGDYLTVPASSNFAPGTGDFTVDAWLYPTSSTIQRFFAQTTSGTNYFIIDADVPNKIVKFIATSSGGGTAINSAATLGLNQWNYICVSRTSGTVTVWCNGSAGTPTVNNTDLNNTTYVPTISGYTHSTSNEPIIGYLAGLRYIKGTALSGAVAPTVAFPVTNTQLLTCQSPTIIDLSINALTVTVNGDAKVSNFTPFAAYQGFNPALGAAAGGVWTIDEAAYYQQNRLWPIYDPYFNQTTLMLHGNSTGTVDSTGTPVYQNNTFLDSSNNNFPITRNGNTTQGSFSPFSQTGWSNYFTSAGLSIPYASSLQLQNTNWTIESYFNLSSASAEFCVMGASNGGGGVPKYFMGGNWSTSFTYNANRAIFFTYTGADRWIDVPFTWEIGRWYHMAAVYTHSNTTITLYINGVSVGSIAYGTGSVTGNILIGRNGEGGGSINGYISNFRYIVGTSLYTSNFTPSTAPLTAITNTQILTCQSNRFLDNSANNFAVSIGAGTPSIQAFSPFVPAYITPTTYSNFFDGNGDYLSLASNAAFNIFNGDMTVECWFYQTSTTNTSQHLFAFVEDATNRESIYFAGTTLTFWTSSSAGSGPRITYSAPTLNTWHHLAIAKSGSTFTMYVDGISAGTSTTTQYSTANQLLRIGTYDGTTAADYFTGVISNVRVVKGTAVYTANFTPPTAPLTNITNTSLLTCQSSTFIDNSTANGGVGFTITATGNVQPVTSPTPFPANVDTTTLNSAYSTSLIGGSAYFDGTGDYLSVAQTTATDLGSGNFTLEFWLYFTGAVTSPYNITGKWNSTTQWLLQWRNAGADSIANQHWRFYTNNGAAPSTDFIEASTTSVAQNTWMHIALVRNGSNFILYRNGVQVGSTYTSSSAVTATSDTLQIASAQSGSNPFQGYMAGYRLVIGSALYTAAFAPPLTPPTNITNTQLLTNYTNGAIFDNTAKNVLETVGNAQISTTQSKWGGSSMSFDGTGDVLIIPYSPTIDLGGTTPFTIEFWIYMNSLAARGSVAAKNDGSSAANSQFDLNIETTGQVNVQFYSGGSAITINSATGVITTSSWIYVALTKDVSGNYKIFINGTQSGSTTTSTSSINSPVRQLTIGAQTIGGGTSLNGYIDDLRITKGVARYITNFTPPTSQLQDQ